MYERVLLQLQLMIPVTILDSTDPKGMWGMQTFKDLKDISFRKVVDSEGQTEKSESNTRMDAKTVCN